MVNTKSGKTNTISVFSANRPLDENQLSNRQMTELLVFSCNVLT